MAKLKELRTQAGFTQKELAQKLGTTQQTVARWESGHTATPIAHLKDIAILFGLSIDELVGVEREPQPRRADQFALTTRSRGAPFGTLTANFEFGPRHYPIDDLVRSEIGKTFPSNRGMAVLNAWIKFVALDNRLVFINPAALREASLVSDEIDAMPFFVSPETYRSLTLHEPAPQAVVVEERARLIDHLAPGENDAKRALEKVETELARLAFVFTNGKERRFYLSYEMAILIGSLQSNLTEVERNAFVVGELGPDLHVINMSKVALVEVPLEAYLNHLNDDDASDGDAPS